jgi:hypothetical protein
VLRLLRLLPRYSDQGAVKTVTKLRLEIVRRRSEGIKDPIASYFTVGALLAAPYRV